MNKTLVKRSVSSRVGNSDFSMMRPLMPEQPWWQNLESNFYKLPDDFELDVRTQMIVKGTAAIDVACVLRWRLWCRCRHYP